MDKRSARAAGRTMEATAGARTPTAAATVKSRRVRYSPPEYPVALVREGLLDILRCPNCASERSFSPHVTARDEREIREGRITCSRCAASFPVNGGIVELMSAPPDHVTREAAGLERFAQVMRDDGWNEALVRRLPYIDHGYWFVQAKSFEQILDAVSFQPGQRLLDVGSNTCWASNRFARLGLEVIALDIATAELQGLRTADYFIRDGEVHFERLLATMVDPPLASESLDYVFCSEVLHHNDRDALKRSLGELYRVLKPGGRLLMMNEPMRFPLNLKRDHGREVASFDGNEHVYFFHEYYRAIRRAGFEISIRRPLYVPILSNDPTTLQLGLPPRQFAAEIGKYLVRRWRPSRQLVLAWKTLIAGDIGLNLIATRPQR